MTRPVRVLHVINTLETGGAETALARLLTSMDRSRFPSRVISLTEGGVLAEEIAALGVPVELIGMRQAPDPRPFARLLRLVGSEPVDVVQTWMYYSNLLGGVTARLRSLPVVWNLRRSELSAGTARRAAIVFDRASARLSSRLPARIVCVAESVREAHMARGYDPARMIVIRNGFDTDRFRPDSEAGLAVRNELGIPPEAPLIGLVARYHPVKGHRVFLEAAGLVARRVPETRFLLCGGGVTRDNPELREAVALAGIEDRALLVGPRTDVPNVMAALDVLALASHQEGFPNVVGEAMATAVPCVVTDVGDAATIVGRTGVVVPPGVPRDLASGMLRLLRLSGERRRELGSAARRKIRGSYAMDVVARRYEELYRAVVTA